MKKTLGVFLKAILAGFCIGVGGNVFLGLTGTNKALGAVLFAQRLSLSETAGVALVVIAVVLMNVSAPGKTA